MTESPGNAEEGGDRRGLGSNVSESHLLKSGPKKEIGETMQDETKKKERRNHVGERRRKQ